jgi:hypothetical protein
MAGTVFGGISIAMVQKLGSRLSGEWITKEVKDEHVQVQPVGAAPRTLRDLCQAGKPRRRMLLDHVVPGHGLEDL